MAKKSVMLDINVDKLRQLMSNARETFSERAQKYGVTRQAIQHWLDGGRMPPRAIIELLRDLDASPADTEELLAPQKEKAKKKWKVTITVEEP